MTVIARDDVTLALVTDVASTAHYFQLKASTASAPTAPTVYPAPSPWVTTEPAYTEGSTNSLYTVDVTVFSDGSFDYTPVSLSSSYEAAKAAYNKAKQAQSAATSAQTAADNAKALANTAQATAQGAQTTADGKNKIFSSASEPAHTGLVPGDLWFQLDSSNHVTGIQVWNGSVFVDYVLMANRILVAGSVGTVQLANGAVTADQITASEALLKKLLVRNISADEIDVGSLAAAIVSSDKFQTANGRMLINDNGLTAKDANGNTTVNIPSDGSTPTMVGGLSTASNGKHISISQSGDVGKLSLLNDNTELTSLTFIDDTANSGYVYTGLYTGQNGQYLQFATLVDSVNHTPDPLQDDASLISNGRMGIEAAYGINVNGTWFARRIGDLPTSPNVVGDAGTKAVVGGVDYVFDGDGRWVSQTHIEDMLSPGQCAGDYTIMKRASVAGNTLILDLKVTRQAPAWRATAWSRAELLSIPQQIAPRVTDFTVPAIANLAEGPTAVGFTISPTDIAIRPIVDCTISPGTFIAASICWDF